MSTAKPKDDSHLIWFTSTYSNGAGGECVECALTDARVLVRDSKSAMGPVVTVRRDAWCNFAQALQHGKLA
ncbi:DUF397 domain-containing protein [Streptomyces sp. NL15-2K]|uniref:DUF397 domain-containing protein n=1 Tax=Streptomyces sp. NL15-2K TaxID=376149 RepID=UPI000F56A9AD|nr:MULTISPECIES: DUF397 domain-containing protein [Actinomycetes]WKX09470.1 DUF397 domain-containing protein [Kutzneria buriramensis]GCB49022.1 hypothetical protein SNL152K_6352 [Streptomyces sp. NL15-2K]